jgi:PX domain-containing protein kinase-like protein
MTFFPHQHDLIKDEFIYRCNVKYQYSAILDSGIGASDRSPRERAARDRAFSACTEWLISTGGRYEVIVHLDDIGSRASKHWFLLNDSAVSVFLFD